MVKKPTAKKASPLKQPASKQSVSKQKPIQAAVSPTPREPRKKIEQWPAVEQLLEQAQACRNFAETLRQNILTTDPNCPLRLPTVIGNVFAIREAKERIAKAYAFYRESPITGYPLLVRAIGAGHRGWEYSVDLPFRNLIRAINGLLIYCDEKPLTDNSFIGPNESPPKMKRVVGRKTKNDGLPMEWLNAVMYSAETLEAELKKSLPPSLGVPGYLHLMVNKDRQEVRREGCDHTVKFLGSTEWELFVALQGAGDRGLTREEINKLSGEQSGKRTLKARLKTTVIPLSLTIPNGQWKLVDTNEWVANRLKTSRGSDVSCSVV